MHLSQEELQKMEQMDFEDVNPDELTDISGIEIDRTKSVSDRVADYIKEVGNPFLVKVGDYIVKISYSDCTETLNDRMMQYIRKITEIN